VPRRHVTINKTNQARIDKWIKNYICEKLDNDIIEFNDFFNKLILNEIKSHKDCTEKFVVTSYIDAFTEYIDQNNINVFNYDDMISGIVMKARQALVLQYVSNNTFDNNIDIYFNEVKREYILHPMNESDTLEFVPENRDIFIKNNLKLVINCAKRYRGLGLPFEDLIQAGNYGLLVAFDKFDKDRANLRGIVINNIDKSNKTTFTYKEACDIVSKSFTYDKDLDRTLKLVPHEGFVSVDDFKVWVKKNVKTAIFASIAFQWIKAYVLMELTKMSSTVKIPKSVKEGSGISHIISLDSVNPHTNDNYHDNQMQEVAAEEFLVEDTSIDNNENEVLFNDIINKIISSLSDINRRIIKKRFGIGFPCALGINDIAESEGLTPNRVKYIISSCLDELQNKLSKKDKMMLCEIFGYNEED
jgi:DNA-directed RNA polymerase sigma subunit (sigma70/sigma32)